jgi:hypothetical protein
LFRLLARLGLFFAFLACAHSHHAGIGLHFDFGGRIQEFPPDPIGLALGRRLLRFIHRVHLNVRVNLVDVPVHGSISSPLLGSGLRRQQAAN